MNLKRLLAWQPFTPTVFLAGVAIALVALVVLVGALLHGRREAAQGAVDGAMNKARLGATSEAMQTVERARDFQDQSEALTRESENAIRNAPGADQALDPRLNDVARRRLCLRDSLRSTPECVQLLGPEKPTR